MAQPITRLTRASGFCPIHKLRRPYQLKYTLWHCYKTQHNVYFSISIQWSYAIGNCLYITCSIRLLLSTQPRHTQSQSQTQTVAVTGSSQSQTQSQPPETRAIKSHQVYAQPSTSSSHSQPALCQSTCKELQYPTHSFYDYGYAI